MFHQKTGVTCRPFQLPANGEVTCTENFQSGSVCSIKCNQCFTLIGSPSRLCRNDGLWSGEPAFCQGEILSVNFS